MYRNELRNFASGNSLQLLVDGMCPLPVTVGWLRLGCSWGLSTNCWGHSDVNTLRVGRRYKAVQHVWQKYIVIETGPAYWSTTRGIHCPMIQHISLQLSFLQSVLDIAASAISTVSPGVTTDSAEEGPIIGNELQIAYLFDQLHPFRETGQSILGVNLVLRCGQPAHKQRSLTS